MHGFSPIFQHTGSGSHTRPAISDTTFTPLAPVRPEPQPPSEDLAPNIPPRPPISKAASKDMPPIPPPKTPLKPPTQGWYYMRSLPPSFPPPPLVLLILFLTSFLRSFPPSCLPLSFSLSLISFTSSPLPLSLTPSSPLPSFSFRLYRQLSFFRLSRRSSGSSEPEERKEAKNVRR